MAKKEFKLNLNKKVYRVIDAELDTSEGVFEFHYNEEDNSDLLQITDPNENIFLVNVRDLEKFEKVFAGFREALFGTKDE